MNPQKKHAAIPSDVCRHCDKELLRRKLTEDIKPSGFELLKSFLMPSQPWGSSKRMTAWDYQKLRDKGNRK